MINSVEHVEMLKYVKGKSYSVNCRKYKCPCQTILDNKLRNFYSHMSHDKWKVFFEKSANDKSLDTWFLIASIYLSFFF